MNESQIRHKLHDLIRTQALGVLGTSKSGQPYNSLVAMAATQDLKCLLFCTSRGTRKYTNIIEDPRVSVLLDNRSNRESDFTDAVAVTILGTAHEIAEEVRDELVGTYLEKHPHLVDFVNSQDTALMKVDVKEYILSDFRNAWTLQAE